jgi:hypothetical protein
MSIRTPLALGLLAAVAACNAASTAPNPPLPTNPDASSSGRPDLGIPASGTVSITILSPGDNALLSTNAPIDVSAEIKVVMGTDFIEPSSVKTSLVPDGSTMPVATGALVGPIGSDQYKGQLSLAGVKSGTYVLVVTAATSSGIATQQQVHISVDSGPQIVVVSPVPGGHYKGGIVVLLAANPGAFPPLMNLQATAGGISIDLQPTMTADNQYRGLVDFNSASPPLAGEQIFIVSAENADGTRTELRFVFVVDNEGPTITNVTPVPGTVLSPVTRIAAQIADDAGLDEASIQVIVSDNLSSQYKLALNKEAGGVWSVLFDSHVFPKCRLDNNDLCVVRPTISFRAADLLGNETTLDYEVAVDNIPPIADLTPPMVRDRKLDMGLRCSRLFDPLSNNTTAGDMPDDRCMVPQVFDLRARIEDDGNRAGGLKTVPISLVDPANTAVYVLDDPTQPLVVDTDGDGYCDAINPKLVPTTQPLTDSRQVLKVNLSPVPKKGNADFRKDPTIAPPQFDPETDCTTGQDDNPPLALCIGNEPTIAISYAGNESSIWSLDPIDDQGYCFGPQFDTYANNVHEDGWKCIAVATQDQNNNASTSAPIRVWLDYNYDGQPGPGTPAAPNAILPPWCVNPPASAGAPPACTGTYDRTSDTVTPGPCKTRSFLSDIPQPELCFQGTCD